MKFDHLTSKKLRDVLSGNFDKKQMIWAFNYTQNALDDDENNEEVNYDVLEKRIEYFEKAKSMLDTDRPQEALLFLQKTWG